MGLFGRKLNTPGLYYQKIFEKHFKDEVYVYPDEFIRKKIAAGSDFNSVKYEYDIIAAEIAKRYNCFLFDFNTYVPCTGENEEIKPLVEIEIIPNKSSGYRPYSEEISQKEKTLLVQKEICRRELLDGDDFLYKYKVQLGALYRDKYFMNAIDKISILNRNIEMSNIAYSKAFRDFKLVTLIGAMESDSRICLNDNLKHIEKDVIKSHRTKKSADISVYYSLRMKQISVELKKLANK